MLCQYSVGNKHRDRGPWLVSWGRDKSSRGIIVEMEATLLTLLLNHS